MYCFFLLCDAVCFQIAPEMTIILRLCLREWQDLFLEACIACPHFLIAAVLLFSLLTGHILSNEMLNCFILGAEAEVIHVSRIKLLYSILQPRWDCGCSSIFNKCLFPRGPCWALWVNSVQEGEACSPHSGAL